VTNHHYLDPLVAAEYDADNGPDREINRDDIPFYVALAREAAAQGHAVLELGCGTGRVTIPMAQAGAVVTGLDNAPPMLDIARVRAQQAGVDVEWITADMASFELGRRFGLIAIPFRSFQLLQTVDALVDCLACVREHLEDDGRLAFNIFNPDVLSGLTGADAAGQRSSIERDDHGAMFTRAARDLRARWIFRAEMEQLLEKAGLEPVSLHGWFDGRQFGADSTEMVWTVRRR
jgi:2-polyprenyl-3-methyl-5-hydroxy-6-metoxy-1,4-benzoquinol methylase